MRYFILFLIILLKQTAVACVCAGDVDVKTDFKYSKVVITVRILEILDPIDRIDTVIAANGEILRGIPVFGYPKRVEIIEVFKGKGIKKIMVIKGDNTNCEVQMKVGQKYIVYGHMLGSQICTNACHRTALLEGNSDLEYLNKKRRIKLLKD